MNDILKITPVLLPYFGISSLLNISQASNNERGPGIDLGEVLLPSTHLSIHPSVHPSTLVLSQPATHPLIYSSIHRSTHTHTHPLINSTIHLPTHPSVHSASHPPTHISIHLTFATFLPYTKPCFWC